jgi:hypothetical protein
MSARPPLDAADRKTYFGRGVERLFSFLAIIRLRIKEVGCDLDSY